MTAPPDAATQADARVRVLLADDSPEVRTLVRVALEEQGLTVVAEAADGAEAIALVDAVRPDVVVLDVAMPVMDGLQALEQITRRYGGAVPVVMLSGFSGERLAEPALRLGAASYVEKRGDLAELTAAIRRAAALGPVVPRPARAPAAPAGSVLVDLEPLAPALAAPGRASTGDDRHLLALLLPALLFAGTFAASLTVSGRADGLFVLYVVPVALAGIYAGLRGGATAAVAASGLFAAEASGDGTVTVRGYVIRITAYLVVGLAVGRNAGRMRRTEAARVLDGMALVAANRRLAEANAAAQAANAALESTNEDLRQFGYVASHDLAEPLRTMSGFAKLVRSRYAEELDPVGQQYLEYVVDGAARMHGLIDDLRAYTRAGQQELRREVVDLVEQVEQVCDSLAATLTERHARVVVEPPLPPVSGDPTLLRLVLQNLVSNGVKFNSSDDPQVRVRASRRRDAVAIEVIDNGIGIAPEHHKRVFGLFQRLHTREEYPGSGLGLAICQRIMARHGGTITLHSSAGAGTTVTLTFPFEES